MLLRNDDVSVDTDMKHFRKWCELCDSYGFIQTHAVTLRGRTNSTHKGKDGAAVSYPNGTNPALMPAKEIKALSKRTLWGAAGTE